MPSFATNVLPTSTGLNLGASNQAWNLWANLLNGSTPVNLSIPVTPWVATPAFTTTSVVTVFSMLLTGNVTSSTFAGVPGILIFQLTQDTFGNRTFAWPASFNGPIAVDLTAQSTTTQIFYFDGANAWPLGPGVVFP